MPRKDHTEQQIVVVLRQLEAGVLPGGVSVTGSGSV
jgi:hypothetical protein